MNTEPGSKSKEEILKEAIISKEGNVIFVDIVLVSMLQSLESLYKSSCPHDPFNVNRKSHEYNLIRHYDRRRFDGSKHIGEERAKYLSEIDLLVQMKRSD